mmetsp:Transcript_18006/g.39920  ORF Transcript_18006/g.39920 Transcript_18006/m.39920 type:complete len:271 (+) Transcript_18006:2984-3796(+)
MFLSTNQGRTLYEWRHSCSTSGTRARYPCADHRISQGQKTHRKILSTRYMVPGLWCIVYGVVLIRVVALEALLRLLLGVAGTTHCAQLGRFAQLFHQAGAIGGSGGGDGGGDCGDNSATLDRLEVCGDRGGSGASQGPLQQLCTGGPVSARECRVQLGDERGHTVAAVAYAGRCGGRTEGCGGLVPVGFVGTSAGDQRGTLRGHGYGLCVALSAVGAGHLAIARVERSVPPLHTCDVRGLPAAEHADRRLACAVQADEAGLALQRASVRH